MELKIFSILLLTILFSATVFATTPSRQVPVVFDSGGEFSNPDELKQYFISNYESIKNSTITIWAEKNFGQPPVLNQTIDLSGIDKLEKCYGKICTETPIKYRVYIPYYDIEEDVKIIDGWPYRTIQTCRNPSESMTTSGTVLADNTTQYSPPRCSSGMIKKEVGVDSSISYLVDETGKIYFSGATVAKPLSVLQKERSVQYITIGNIPILSKYLLGKILTSALIIGLTILIAIAGFRFLMKRKKE